MKRLLFVLLMIPIYIKAQEPAILAGFNGEYIIMDTCNLSYGKELSRGNKNDSCLVLRYYKTLHGTEWLKIKTADTVGFVIMDFILLNKANLDLLKKRKSDIEVNPTYDEWLSKNKKVSILKNEIEKERRSKQVETINRDFKLFLSKSVLFITSYSFPESEYLKYPGFNISIYNSQQKKTIKYTWFTVNAYNPVNDLVGTKTVQAIGPVAPLEFGDYKFEFVFKSNIVETCKIIKIKIQYMDGSVIYIDRPEIDRILLKQEIFWSYIEKMQEL